MWVLFCLSVRLSEHSEGCPSRALRAACFPLILPRLLPPVSFSPDLALAPRVTVDVCFCVDRWAGGQALGLLIRFLPRVPPSLLPHLPCVCAHTRVSASQQLPASASLRVLPLLVLFFNFIIDVAPPTRSSSRFAALAAALQRSFIEFCFGSVRHAHCVCTCASVSAPVCLQLSSPAPSLSFWGLWSSALSLCLCVCAHARVCTCV